MKGKLLGFALAVLSVATIGVVQMQANAVVDSSPDCDQWAVIWCGSYSPADARNAVKNGAKNSPNLAKIFGALGIQASEINGDYRAGIVYQDGRIVVNGKVVATNARMAARNLGGNPIAGTNAGVMSVNKMGSAQTAMVKFDSNGRFVHAIMKPCGNPVAATPTKPEPKPVAKCESLKAVKISDNRFRLEAKAMAKDGAKIKSYHFVVMHEGKQVFAKNVDTDKENAHVAFESADPGNYKASVVVKTSEGPRDGAQCTDTFSIPKKPFAVCKDLTVEKISRTKFRFNASANAKNGATIKAYTFSVYKDGALVQTLPQVTTNKETASVTYTQTTAGNYVAKVVVKTSLGNRDGEQCEAPFEVTEKPPTPVATCKDLTVDVIEDNAKFRFNGEAEVSGGATISGYEFAVYRGNSLVDTLPVSSTATTASADYSQTTPGNYTVRLTVKTSEGDRNGDQCVATFSVDQPEENPGVKVTKLVEGVKNKRVGVNVEFTYQIAVTNTGDVDLENVLVTDTPESQVALIAGNVGTVANNTWTYTIPVLTVGEIQDFTLTAKVPAEVANQIKNTVCVDAPEVPGNPDDCDDAYVDVKKVPVCNPETGEIIRVDESEASNYEPVDSPKCDEPEVPEELPQTGAAEVVMQLVGATSLAGAGTYYLASRRKI
ncbi:MAG TPA: LPXTG cell wall anchor domain-containing protein [Candidatus Saccharibacteria bacterium]|nr:LPXTG cell wall anchor domain-containing protein [Candidatus Saccharibacteria bacterium]